MNISENQKFEIIKMEMELIQTTIDKYDDLIFRNRNWFITIWIAAIGLAFTIGESLIFLFTIALSIFFWIIEGLMRYQYWYKYVIRYRTLRDIFNKEKSNINEVSLYDLTNRKMKSHKSNKNKLKETVFKLLPTIVYSLMALISFTCWLLTFLEVIDISNNL